MHSLKNDSTDSKTFEKSNNVTYLLVAKAQRGDKQAFEKLVQIYQQRILNLAVHLSGNGNDAQDIAQDAFISAYRAIGSFRQESDFGSWLHRITVNCWHNYCKKAQRKATVSLDEPIENNERTMQREIAATGGDPAEAAVEKELQQEILSAMGNLSPEHRSALVLREIQELSYEEIAETLQCSLGTVKSRINRARAAMRDLLADTFTKQGR